MAYKYFTEKLLSSGIDTSDVFPEKQEIARENNNVSYNLGDIAIYIKDVTDNFKVSENQYIELDNAISEIVAKWYKSKGEKNPFVEEIDAEAALKEFASNTPREAAIVDKGDLKSKGAPASAPSSKKETLSEKGKKFKNDLAFQKEVLYDDLDDAAKEDYKLSVEQKLEANELMADFGDEEFVERVKILKDFIKSLK
jgi:hypothetical protein